MPTGPGTRGRNDALTAVRRRDILAAAIKVFGRKGFASARAEDIAAAAGIAKGTLYLYFPSKEDIYSAAIGSAVRQLQQQAAERIGSVVGMREKLELAIAVRLQFWIKSPELYRLMLTIGREPRHRRQTNTLLRSGQEALAALLAEGASTGELAGGDFHAIAWAILDMIRGATERRLDGVSTCTPEHDAEVITRIVMARLLPGESAPVRAPGKKRPRALSLRPAPPAPRARPRPASNKTLRPRPGRSAAAN